MLRLRSAVFVVEQNCVYLDFDGRDTERGTRHVYAGEAGEIAGYLRVLEEPDGTLRIGRVVVDPAWRGKGVADGLMEAALATGPGRTFVLNAQTGAVKLYLRHGFTVCGPEFLEDDIPHVPMISNAPNVDSLTIAPSF